MKKILALILAACCVLALASCRGVEGDDPFKLADSIEKQAVFAAALVDLLRQGSEGGDGKQCRKSRKQA